MKYVRTNILFEKSLEQIFLFLFQRFKKKTFYPPYLLKKWKKFNWNGLTVNHLHRYLPLSLGLCVQIYFALFCLLAKAADFHISVRRKVLKDEKSMLFDKICSYYDRFDDCFFSKYFLRFSVSLIFEMKKKFIKSLIQEKEWKSRIRIFKYLIHSWKFIQCDFYRLLKRNVERFYEIVFSEWRDGGVNENYIRIAMIFIENFSTIH